MKKLKYEPEKEYMEVFTPIKSTIPIWYKDTKLSYNETLSFDNAKSFTFKACVPFLDAMTCGYAVTLPGDLICNGTPNGSFFNWADGSSVLVKVRDLRSLGNMPIPPEFKPEAFAWSTNVHIDIPKGYSVLVTHPFNRYDLPFLTLSGIVDNMVLFDGNLPFLFRKDFSGIIPVGTPIAQIVPFKRENWDSEKQKGVKQKGEINHLRSMVRWKGWYKATHWKKKTYN